MALTPNVLKSSRPDMLIDFFHLPHWVKTNACQSIGLYVSHGRIYLSIYTAPVENLTKAQKHGHQMDLVWKQLLQYDVNIL